MSSKFDAGEAFGKLLTGSSIHKIILDDLGVRQIATVVGGSMGGMLCLEWAYFGKEYIRSIVPIATAARHSAWGISWGEAQRQSIYSDPKYEDGYYPFEDPPITGLGAARMSALLTYRSRDSFEARFGRNTPDSSKQQSINGPQKCPGTPSNEHWSIHNDGHKSTRGSRPPSANGTPSIAPRQNPFNSLLKDSSTPPAAVFTDPQFNGTKEFAMSVLTRRGSRPTNHYFSAQSYLRYQGTKFVGRFDSNCYIAITRKLDTHDVSRNRASTVREALQQIEQPALILGIESDGLFTFAEQQELADGISNSRLGKIDSPEGHDAFLLQFEQVNRYLLGFFREVLPDIMERPDLHSGVENGIATTGQDGVSAVTKSSTFGEAEVEDLTAW
jgi:homoserine O-acetyltransferase/O-succinyltransferase